MEFSYPVVLEKYESTKSPDQLAVGDVIRCPGFRLGHRTPKTKDLLGEVLTPIGSEAIIRVAWRDEGRMQHYINWQNSTNWGKDSMVYANDETRGQALFIVTFIGLVETWGPEDVGAPALLYRMIYCSRLKESESSLSLNPNAERICFYMDDPMACCSPNPDHIEMVGHGRIQTAW